MGIAVHVVIKPVTVYQSTKLVMRKILVGPAAPVYEQPNGPSAVGKSCSVCMNPIRTRYADLAYHCANPSCGNVCHLAVTCSGFVYPRRKARPRALSTRVWHCDLHSSPSATSHPSLSPNNLPPRDNLWKCAKCTNLNASESTNRVLPGPTNSLPSQPVPSTSRNKLKIYQWNADGIRPKLLKL